MEGSPLFVNLTAPLLRRMLAALATRVAGVVRPVLPATGGVCIVSQAQWLRH